MQKFNVRIIGIAKAILAGLAVFALRVLIERLESLSAESISARVHDQITFLLVV